MPKPPRKDDREYDDAVFTEGEEEARQLVARFIKKLTESTEVESGFKVKLMQCGTGMEVRVDAFTYELDYSPEDFAEDVVKRAVDDIQSHRGAVKYAVRAFVGGRDRVERFRLSVPRTEAEEDEEFGEDSLEEAPTRRGMIHQNMRHSEVLMREHRHGMVLVVRSLEGQLNTSLQRIKELEQRLREYQDREEDVSSLKWVRELESKRIESEELRKEQGLKMLQSAVPLLLSNVIPGAGNANPLAAFGQQSAGQHSADQPEQDETRGNPFQQPAQPPSDPLRDIHARQDLLLDAVFEAVTMDHVQQLMQVLPPTVIGALAELNRCCQERRGVASDVGVGQTNGTGDTPRTQPRP